MWPNLPVVIRKIMDVPHKPFLHRLVTLLVTTFLAISLVSAALVTAFSRSGNEVTSISEILMYTHRVEHQNVLLKRDFSIERWQRS